VKTRKIVAKQIPVKDTLLSLLCRAPAKAQQLGESSSILYLFFWLASGASE
jgi:hypothetical protein